MKDAKLFGLDGKSAKDVELPKVFNTPYRPDVIKRAVLAEQSTQRQPYGTDLLAGKRSSAHYHGSRHYIFSMMNKELARLPRIHGKAAGHMNLRVRTVPHSVKGRRAIPPKVEKNWLRLVNNKEMKLALRSALAASTNPELLKLRGHFHTESPIILVDDFENVNKTKSVVELLMKIGLENDMERAQGKKVRAGRGKTRGRKYKRRKGIAIIVSKDCNAIKACAKMPGVDVCKTDDLKAEMLAPGAQAGRLLVITEAALKELDKL